MANNTTGVQDRVLSRAEDLENEIPIITELLDIIRDLDQRLDDETAKSSDKDL